MKVTIQHVKDSITGRVVFTCLPYALLIVASSALSPAAQAVSPPPDGGYAGENTVEGTSALLHLNGGTNNTAVGWASLGFDVTGIINRAAGDTTTHRRSENRHTFGTIETRRSWRHQFQRLFRFRDAGHQSSETMAAAPQRHARPVTSPTPRLRVKSARLFHSTPSSNLIDRKFHALLSAPLAKAKSR